MANNNAINNDIGVSTGTSLNLGSTTTIDGFLDEDNMSSDSATKGCTQQSIKAYADSLEGRLEGVQVITASGTYTKTSGVSKIIVECLGAGGGGGGIDANTSQISVAGGGGAGGYAVELIDASAIVSETATIGSGGSGGAAGANPGSAGGTTSLGSLISATGGAGGQTLGPSSASNIVRQGGSGGVGSGGSVNANGQTGGVGIGQTIACTSGMGGTSIYGRGGNPGIQNGAGTSFPGINALGYGSGGSGAGATGSTTNQAGGDGTDGLLIIWEYS